jgi:uncharacterized membrane protein
MSRKWLVREGPSWVQEGIVSSEQYERILAKYPSDRRSIGLLPIFGGLFLGLGILSFVAANWQGLPELFRILLLVAAMVGSYLGGVRLLNRGNPNIGIAVVGIGLFFFGGSIILIGQMFHMIAFSAMSILIWAIAGTILTYLFKSRYLGVLSLLLTTIAQIYSLQGFNTFSIPAFVLLLAGLGVYVFQRQDRVLTFLWSSFVVIQSLMLVTSYQWNFGWFFIALLLLYTLGDWWEDVLQRWAIQIAPLAAAFIVSVTQVLINIRSEWREQFVPDPRWFVPVMVLLLAVSWYVKRLRNDQSSMPALMLFLPYFYVPDVAVSIVYLAVLFVFSLYVLLRGYAKQSREQTNIGTALFLITTMVAYFKLTWSFMDKSLFFIIGGLLLLLLSWLLNYRNRKMLQKNGGTSE